MLGCVLSVALSTDHSVFELRSTRPVELGLSSPSHQREAIAWGRPHVIPHEASHARFRGAHERTITPHALQVTTSSRRMPLFVCDTIPVVPGLKTWGDDWVLKVPSDRIARDVLASRSPEKYTAAMLTCVELVAFADLVYCLRWDGAVTPRTDMSLYDCHR